MSRRGSGRKSGRKWFKILLALLLIKGAGTCADETSSASMRLEVPEEGHPEAYEAAKEEPLPEAGFRERLARKGLGLGLNVTSEYLARIRGGLEHRRNGEYLGSVDASFRLDFAKAFGGRGQIFIGAQNLHGRGINNPSVGAFQSHSSLDALPFTKVVEAWYSDQYFQGRLRTKLGRQYADADFGLVENGADFVNSSYGLIPNNPMPTHPSPRLGASIWVDFLPWMSAGAGIFRGADLDNPDSVSTPSRQGPYTVVEVNFRQISHSGIFRLGAWQQSRGAWLHQTGTDRTSHPGRNYGFYGTVDYSFRKGSEEGGPALFLQWGWAPPDRNEINGYWGGGISYNGILHGRPKDVVGIGLTRAGLRNSTHETVIECFYKWQALSFISVQPDLQWVLRPGGNGKNTLVLGTRIGYEF